MAFSKSKAQDLFTPNRSGGQGRISYFRLGYESNRVSGQIVKRQSPMDMIYAHYTRFKPSGSLDAGNEWVVSQLAGFAPGSSRAYGRAYARFKKLVDVPTAEMLLNVVQGQQALEMMTARLFQARQIAHNLRKGRLGDAWNFITLNPTATLESLSRSPAGHFRFKNQKVREQMILNHQRWRTFVKDVGSCVLEIQYGWRPLIGDLVSLAQMLSTPYPSRRLKATASTRYTRTDVSIDPYHWVERVTIVGAVRVNNPNLDLANRLGLLNVPYVLYDATPFSFLFDWLLPVGNFLQSLSDFAGIEFVDASVTGRAECVAPKRRGYVYVGNTTSQTLDFDAYSFHGVRQIRTVGGSLPRPPLMMATGLSAGRAINAVALLAQLVKPETARKAYG